MPRNSGSRGEDEFEEFARARAAQLYRSAWLLCGSHHQAEDLVQETLAKVYAKWHRPFGRIDNPAAYAQTALTRTFLSARRRRSSDEKMFGSVPDQPTADPADGSDVRLSLLNVLGELPAQDRSVLILRYFEDLSVEEVATRMGLSAGAVRNRAMRALERVRGLVDDSLLIRKD